MADLIPQALQPIIDRYKSYNPELSDAEFVEHYITCNGFLHRLLEVSAVEIKTPLEHLAKRIDDLNVEEATAYLHNYQTALCRKYINQGIIFKELSIGFKAAMALLAKLKVVDDANYLGMVSLSPIEFKLMKLRYYEDKEAGGLDYLNEK